MLSNKQSVEEVLIQRAVKMTVQKHYDKGFFDNYDNADEVLKDYFFVERRKPDLDPINDNDNVIQWFHP